MYYFSFPPCPFPDAPLTPPVEHAHLGHATQIPAKCSGCANAFEGSCRRDGYFHNEMPFDMGPCPMPGATSPVEHAGEGGHTQLVPRKCASCEHLSSHHSCSLVMEGWERPRRALDWGDWLPDHLVPMRFVFGPIEQAVDAVRRDDFDAFDAASEGMFRDASSARAFFDRWREINAAWSAENERALNERG